jgi:hypothetical protein
MTMTATKIMIAVAFEASTAVNMFLYIVIHDDDSDFVLYHGEKEKIQKIILRYFPRSMTPWRAIGTNIMT